MVASSETSVPITDTAGGTAKGADVGVTEKGTATAPIDDSLSGIAETVSAPPALVPSPPTHANLGGLTGTPCFQDYIAELEEQQAANRRLYEVVAAGRRLTHALVPRLQRSDVLGALAVVKSIKELPAPRLSMGETIWGNPERRLRFYEASGAGNVFEAYVSSLGLMSFLNRGVLTPEIPEDWCVGIQDQDDERYLLGLIGSARELERYAVNRGKEMDLRSIRICLSAAQCLEQALLQFDLRNSELRRRFDGVKYIVKRLENLVYEVDLAQQRAKATAAASEALNSLQNVGLSTASSSPIHTAPTSSSCDDIALTESAVSDCARVIDLDFLQAIKERYDRFDSTRELVIKRSRDVIKSAKNSIHALQRADYRKADADLKQCAKDANSIHTELVGLYPALRGGLFSASLEEMAEAITYRSFRKEWRLMSQAEVQDASGLTFPITLHEYLGGIMDLTGEVGRFAIRSASKGRSAVADVELCLSCVDAVYSGCQELPNIPGSLGKKMGPLKGTLSKIEGVLYELALLSQGLRVQAPEPLDEERDNA